MSDEEYIEGLAKELCRQACELMGIIYDEAYIRNSYQDWVPQAQAITDWHREQGLRVVPKEYVRLGIMALDKDNTKDKRSCPHAKPHRYCFECVVTPCPIGLDAAKGDEHE